jgi:type I restriction-modification system DNA methylase subunit
MTDYKKAIIRELERCGAAGVQDRDIFQDWLFMVHSMLTMMPDHLKAIKQTGSPAEDTPEIAERWAKLRDRYKTPWYWEKFQKATALLLDSTEDYNDTVGEIYMEFGYPSKGSGQFFTPFHLARANAEMLDVGSTVHELIKDAIMGDPLSEALLMASLPLEGEAMQEWFVTRIVPSVADRIKPITVNDPSCGSGVMFLAVASTLPAWMTQMGLVQFYGQDIDQTCVLMCQINIMLYGLNGHSIRCAVALTEQPIVADGVFTQIGFPQMEGAQ